MAIIRSAEDALNECPATNISRLRFVSKKLNYSYVQRTVGVVLGSLLIDQNMNENTAMDMPDMRA